MSITRGANVVAAVALLLVAAFAPRLEAQSGAPVDPAERTYRWLERLADEGLMSQALLAQRPLGRLELARLTMRAREAWEARDAVPTSATSGARHADAAEMLRALEAELAREIAAHRAEPWAPHAELLESARLQWLYLDSPRRRVPDVGPDVGGADAWINPLVDNRQGRVERHGHSAALETRHRVQPFRHLTLSASTRLQAASGRMAAEMRTLSLATGFRNVRLVAGREHVTWGPGMWGGPGLSMNAPPLDLVSVSSDRPFVLPWILRLTGPVRATVFASDLGASQNFPHARLIGYDVRAAPASWLELGVSVLTQMGGSGAPPATLGERLVDVVPLLDVIFLGDRDLQISNKMAGADVRVRIPRAAGLELYVQSMLDDFDVRRLGSSLWEDNGIVAGLRLPRVTADGRTSARAEWHHTGIRYYQHLQFRSGLTRNGVLLGDALGPRGSAAYVQLAHDSGPWQRVLITLAAERRSGDVFRTVYRSERDDSFRFEKIQDLPEEDRARVTASIERPLSRATPAFGVEMEAGYERAMNWSFRQDAARDNLLARLALTRRF